MIFRKLTEWCWLASIGFNLLNYTSAYSREVKYDGASIAKPGTFGAASGIFVKTSEGVIFVRPSSGYFAEPEVVLQQVVDGVLTDILPPLPPLGKRFEIIGFHASDGGNGNYNVGFSINKWVARVGIAAVTSWFVAKIWAGTQDGQNYSTVNGKRAVPSSRESKRDVDVFHAYWDCESTSCMQADDYSYDDLYDVGKQCIDYAVNDRPNSNYQQCSVYFLDSAANYYTSSTYLGTCDETTRVGC